MDSGWAGVLIALLTTGLVYREVALARDQTRHGSIELERLMASRWDELAPDWQVAVMVARFPQDHYVDATSAVIESYEQFLARRASLVVPLSMAEADIEAWGAQHRQLVREARPYELSVRRVLRYLDWVGGLVLRGRVAPSDAYATFGTELVRNARPIVKLVLGEDKADQPSTNAAFWVDYYPGLQIRVLTLLDVLWAEAARLEDLSAVEIREVAEHKAASGSGYRNRRRIWVAARRHGSWLVAAKLRRHLRHAERRPAIPSNSE